MLFNCARIIVKRSDRDPAMGASVTRPLWVRAVQRRRFPVGANPTRQSLQPEAIGAVMEVTKYRSSLSGDDASSRQYLRYQVSNHE